MKAVRFNQGTKFLLIVGLTTLLVSCGGGGGGSNEATPSQVGTPPVQQPVTGSITSVSDVAIPLDASSGTTTIVWTSNAAQAGDVRVRLNGTEVSTQPASPQGGLMAQVGNGDVRVELVNSAGVVLDTRTAKATCAMGAWEGGRCDRFRFSRLDVVVESLPTNPGDVPISVLRDGQAIRLVNRTGYEVQPGAGIPLSNCLLYSIVREDNAPLAACTTIATGNQLRVFPINPVTLELMPEYAGPIPAGAVQILGLYGTFGDSPYAQYGVGQSGMYIAVPGYGVYYFTNVEPRRILLTRDMFQTNMLVMESRATRVLYSFSPR